MNFTELLIASSISLAVASAGGSMLLNEHNSSQTLSAANNCVLTKAASSFTTVKFERVFDDPLIHDWHWLRHQ